jgi:formate-dependent nitrite reductase cytochrome c552 subunit
MIRTGIGFTLTVLVALALSWWAKGSLGLPRVEASPCPRLDEPKYAGSKSCQKCHFKEYSSWQKTKMAQTFKSLSPNESAEAKKRDGLEVGKDYTKDVKCVSCHVTGYGKPGGYPAIVEGKEWSAEEKARATLLENVGCESCHGPGEQSSALKKDNKEYKWADIAKLGAVHPDPANCAQCHNKESPGFKEFKYEEKIGKDTHEILKLKFNHDCPHTHHEGK